MRLLSRASSHPRKQRSSSRAKPSSACMGASRCCCLCAPRMHQSIACASPFALPRTKGVFFSWPPFFLHKSSRTLLPLLFLIFPRSRPSGCHCTKSGSSRLPLVRRRSPPPCFFNHTAPLETSTLNLPDALLL